MEQCLEDTKTNDESNNAPNAKIFGSKATCWSDSYGNDLAYHVHQLKYKTESNKEPLILRSHSRRFGGWFP